MKTTAEERAAWKQGELHMSGVAFCHALIADVEELKKERDEERRVRKLADGAIRRLDVKRDALQAQVDEGALMAKLCSALNDVTGTLTLVLRCHAAAFLGENDES